jgi:hypothetical protein
MAAAGIAIVVSWLILGIVCARVKFPPHVRCVWCG